MKIWIENYNEAKRFKPSEPTIAIRVFDPGARPYKLASARWDDYPDDCWDNCPEAPFDKDAYLAVLSYTFSDLNLDVYGEETCQRLRNDPSNVFFTAEMAEDLVSRFSAIYEQVDSILAHCNAGGSRSVGMMFALIDTFEIEAEYLGSKGKHFSQERFVNRKIKGNDLVYRLVCEAAERLN